MASRFNCQMAMNGIEQSTLNASLSVSPVANLLTWTQLNNIVLVLAQCGPHMPKQLALISTAKQT